MVFEAPEAAAEESVGPIEARPVHTSPSMAPRAKEEA